LKLEHAEAWLSELVNVERQPDLRRARLSLSPMRALLARLGEPQRGLRVLHVAGSKGKGSVALIAEAILQETGLRVGTYTSPHLERWVERFRIGGAEVADPRLAALIERLKPHVEALRDSPDAPSWFDVTTAAALCLFADERVDCAVLEVGLGGRLDSTNVVEPSVCCITSIELEHTEKLGQTLSQIAGEKAGILKRGVPAVLGVLPDEAAAVVRERAGSLGVPLAVAQRDLGSRILCEDLEGSLARFDDGPLSFEARLGCLGEHQVGNALLALAAVRRMGVVSDAALAEAAPAALARVRLPGRIELAGRHPWLLIDSAHTAASARALGRVLARIERRSSHLVLSVSAGKDLGSICRALVPRADQVTVTRAEPVRSLTPPEVATAVRCVAPQAAVRVVPNPHLALRAARESLARDDLLCATGSVYLAGIARHVLRAPGPDAA